MSVCSRPTRFKIHSCSGSNKRLETRRKRRGTKLTLRNLANTRSASIHPKATVPATTASRPTTRAHGKSWKSDETSATRLAWVPKSVSVPYLLENKRGSRAPGKVSASWKNCCRSTSPTWTSLMGQTSRDLRMNAFPTTLCLKCRKWFQNVKSSKKIWKYFEVSLPKPFMWLYFSDEPTHTFIKKGTRNHPHNRLVS